jgi:hypothetical protein
MPSTVADRREHTWRLRRYEASRLAVLRLERHTICGCERCGDVARGVELDFLIRRSEAAVQHYTDQLCERSFPC